MPGILKDEGVIVYDEKEGNQIYNKGYFGEPLSGGGVNLNIFEALYLVKDERLTVENQKEEQVDAFELMKRGVKSDEHFQKNYFVYEDMRKRGYVVKPASDPADFRVFPRGGGPGKTPSKYWISTKHEMEEFCIENILELIDKTNNIKKRAMIGMVDCEKDVTYYNLSTIDLKGEIDLPEEKTFEGCFIEDDIILKNGQKYGNENENDETVNEKESKISREPYLMDIIFLIENDLATFDDGEGENSISDRLKSVARKKIDRFQMKYEIYKDLRRRGLIPKTGFKYGSVFRCYLRDPTQYHAEYLVQPVKEAFNTSWYNVSKSVRLAHSVKKDLLYAVSENEEIKYVKIKRETP